MTLQEAISTHKYYLQGFQLNKTVNYIGYIKLNSANNSHRLEIGLLRGVLKNSLKSQDESGFWNGTEESPNLPKTLPIIDIDNSVTNRITNVYYKETKRIKLCENVSKKRPAAGGYSISSNNRRIFTETGTLGANLKIKGNLYSISSWHLLDRGYGTNRDLVWQQGYGDGGNRRMKIARYSMKLLTDKAEAVIAKCYSPCAEGIYYNNTIIKLRRIAVPQFNKEVTKVGRATDISVGQVRHISCDVWVPDFPGGGRWFCDQVQTTNWVLASDSGSILFDNSNTNSVKGIGLLMAHDENYAYFNKLKYIIDEIKNLL